MRKIFYLFLVFLLFLSIPILVIGYAQKDNTPPQVSIINPQNGQVVSGIVKIQVKATDNVGVTKVEYYIDGKKVGESTKSPYEYSWDTTKYANGNHTIQVKAYDKAGNVGNAKITVNVQNIKQNVWQKTFGGSGSDWASSIQQTKDGGYVIAGYTESFGAGGCDVYIIKLDENGNKVWEKTFGGSGCDTASCIKQISDGGYIVAGETNSFGEGNWEIYIIKLDENGNKLWQETFGGADNYHAVSIQQTKDGGYIVAGYIESESEICSVYIIKLKENGSKVWEKIYGGNDDDRAYSIQQTTDGGYIIAGYTKSFGAGESDIYVIKLDENGHIVWQKTYGGSNYDLANSIQQTKDGGYIIAGYTESFGTGGRNVYIIKLDENGEKEWEKIYNINYLDEAFSIMQTADGGYIVAGYTYSFGEGGSDVYIIKLKENGSKVWEKIYGGNDHDGASSVQQTTDGGYIVAGGTSSFGAGKSDVYVIKIDKDGNTGLYPTPTIQYAQKDNTPPKASITSPQNGQTVSGTVIIQASTTDNVGVSKVEFYIDGNKVGEDTESPYTYDWNTNNLQYNSTHTIQVKAYDNAGNAGVSPEITVTIGNSEVEFADPNLEKAVRDALGIPEDQPITKEKMKELKSLDAHERYISNLSGLEYAVNLQELDLSGNQIRDISPLSNLIYLEVLILEGNDIRDISPLAKLTNLTVLDLNYNKISDISPLVNLANLQELYLNSNRISDISPLSKLTCLQVLELAYNRILGIDPLAELTNLKELHLEGNRISDISPLIDNPGLGEGDCIFLQDNLLDLIPGSGDMEDIYILDKRGVEIWY
jgi:Leucine-rich repeat (LRR) protein